MIEITLLLLANSLLCLGVWVATQWDGSDTFDEYGPIEGSQVKDPMALWWVRWYGSLLPKFWQKPLYRCLPCMASVWSVPVLTTAVLMGMLSPVQALILAPTYILSLAGLNYIVANKFT